MMKLEINKDGNLIVCAGVDKELRLPPEVRGILGISTPPLSAFAGCDSLERLVLPATVEWVETGGLDGAKNLRALIVEGEGTALDLYACAGCKKLEHIVFPHGNRRIENSAFEGTIWLKDQPYSAWIRDSELLCYGGDAAEFEIPAHVAAIGEAAFLGNQSIRRVIIGKQVRRIGDGAFSYCTRLSDVRINGAPQIAPDAFDDTPWLAKQAGLFLNGARLLRYVGRDERIAVPDGVTEVCDNAFEGNEAIRAVLLPRSVKSVGKSAFAGCVNMEEIKLPEGIGCIASFAFAGCGALEQISLPASVRAIGRYAFSNCKSLKRIVCSKRHIKFCEGSFCHCDALRQSAGEYGIPAGAFEPITPM